MNHDLKIIKKYYGEAMMHYCRNNFSTIIDYPNKLSEIFLNKIHPTKTIFEDLKNANLLAQFKNYIYTLYDVSKTTTTEKKTSEMTKVKTPKELLDEAGYKFYECKTEEDIQQFKKYYARNEQLCTFRGNRLASSYVFWAVKKNVDEIKRENYPNPEREDEYGTSVISIQFTRNKYHYLSIKNRYNHKVNNPDATFHNNLDEIIPGLTDSFAKYYKMYQYQEKNPFEIPNYVRALDGKLYKYNMEINNVYYCPGNVIIDNFEVKKYDKERYLIVDYFIIDMKTKEIKLYDPNLKDSTSDSISKIQKISITKNKDYNQKNLVLTTIDKQVSITINNDNQLIYYKDNQTSIIKSNFLTKAHFLQKIELDNVQLIEDNFLKEALSLEEIYLPKVKVVGDDFLRNSRNLLKIILPQVEIVGKCFALDGVKVKEVLMNNLELADVSFLRYNNALTQLSLPNLKVITDAFLYDNKILSSIYLPNLEKIGKDFLYQNNSLISLILPKIKIIGDNFLMSNEVLEKIIIETVENIGDYFLWKVKNLVQISTPNIKSRGNYCLYHDINIPNVQKHVKKAVSQHFKNN